MRNSPKTWIAGPSARNWNSVFRSAKPSLLKCMWKPWSHCTSTLAESAKPRSTKMGHTRALRAETQDYIVGDLTFRLLAADQRLIRVTIARSTDLPDSWLDPDIAVLDPRERLKRLQQSVVKSDDGTVSITGLQSVPQGYRPYCGLNSLAIASRHFGLHIDEDWLAVAGGFKNTGSADGSNILRLYSAVAAKPGCQ